MFHKSTKDLKTRLHELEKTITQPDFCSAKGKANEVNYWVFDYDAQDELKLRRGICDIQKREEGKVKIQIFDIYDIIIDYLIEKKFLEKTFTLEERKGLAGMSRAIGHSLRISNDPGGVSGNRIVEFLEKQADPNAILFLKGVGKCYPILRAQEIFNQVFYNMPAAFSHTPMILFYPGVYTEQELRIFDEMHEDNYYRAFRIVR